MEFSVLFICSPPYKTEAEDFSEALCLLTDIRTKKKEQTCKFKYIPLLLFFSAAIPTFRCSFQCTSVLPKAKCAF